MARPRPMPGPLARGGSGRRRASGQIRQGPVAVAAADRDAAERRRLIQQRIAVYTGAVNCPHCADPTTRFCPSTGQPHPIAAGAPADTRQQQHQQQQQQVPARAPSSSVAPPAPLSTPPAAPLQAPQQPPPQGFGFYSPAPAPPPLAPAAAPPAAAAPAAGSPLETAAAQLAAARRANPAHYSAPAAGGFNESAVARLLRAQAALGLAQPAQGALLQQQPRPGPRQTPPTPPPAAGAAAAPSADHEAPCPSGYGCASFGRRAGASPSPPAPDSVAAAPPWRPGAFYAPPQPAGSARSDGNVLSPGGGAKRRADAAMPPPLRSSSPLSRPAQRPHRDPDEALLRLSQTAKRHPFSDSHGSGGGLSAAAVSVASDLLSSPPDGAQRSALQSPLRRSREQRGPGMASPAFGRRALSPAVSVTSGRSIPQAEVDALIRWTEGLEAPDPGAERVV
eukprot:TRINITY_DN10651_c0_g2_i1.p1 TRINITY_DN10651_c0_g2~~TRINITY_DN10651_c0_g2_i1.p1  ORF type:complete len:450 (+),score=95.02 TRINITY_DN10651_c0_g2_i1:365-1714(+)